MEKNKPCYEARLGSVRVAIWENHKDGKTWHNVAIARRYKDGEEWKEASTFNGLADLAHVNTAVWLAQEWLRKRQDQQPQQQDTAE